MSRARLRLDAFVPYRLSFTSNLVSETIARAYGQLFGLNIPEWRLVTVLAETEGATQLEIGRRTRMDKVTVSRAAIALAGRGLVARSLHPSDRRSHILSLTGAGWELYDSVVPKAQELEGAIFGGFDPQELARFVDMLRRIDVEAANALEVQRAAGAPSHPDAEDQPGLAGAR